MDVMDMLELAKVLSKQSGKILDVFSCRLMFCPRPSCWLLHSSLGTDATPLNPFKRYTDVSCHRSQVLRVHALVLVGAFDRCWRA